MLNLMKLELRRMNTKSVLLSFILINVGMISILLLLGIEPEATVEFFSTAEDVMMLIELLSVTAFVIYASVLLSSLIVEEFKNKTITLLFMYPINRKKLLFSKIIIISLLTFCFVIISEIVVFFSFSLLNNMFDLISVPLPAKLFVNEATHLLVTAVACAGLSLIPLFFGMIKYSVPATITSSILIISIIASTSESGTNLLSITVIPLMLGVLGFVVAYIVINKAVKREF